MSFKYRFILSFVLLELFFIILIVGLNFFAIDSSSKTLLKDKMDSDMTFLSQLVKVPISIYDLATLDDILLETKSQKFINSVIVLDAQNVVLSKEYNFKHKPLDDIIKANKEEKLSINTNRYEIRYKKLFEDDVFLGSLYIIFDTTENSMFIEENKKRTIIIVVFEILISTIVSYLLGNRLTKMLINLTKVSDSIANRIYVDVPYQDRKGEIGILARSMDSMSKQINESYINLQQLTYIQDKQKKDLEEANKSKDDFLANMSHELKTPLNSINVISSVMMKNKDELLNEDQIKNLKIINSCGNDLLFLINDVLDISKLEAGEMKLNYETFSLKEVIENIKNMIEPQAQEKGLDFILEYNMQTELIYSDKQRYKQIIKNLLSNSMKFVKNGYIKLKLTENDDFFITRVEDNGIGISKDKLEKIFDRFKQADGSTTRKFGGTGLGLSICKELSHLLKGDIKAESQENIKTIFSVVLPKNSSKITKEHEKLENEEILKKDNFNILILNNDPFALMNFTIALKNNYNVEQVDSVDEIEEKEKQNNYKLILLDTKELTDIALEKMIDKFGEKLVLLTNKEDSKANNKIKLELYKPIDTQDALNQIAQI